MVELQKWKEIEDDRGVESTHAEGWDDRRRLVDVEEGDAAAGGTRSGGGPIVAAQASSPVTSRRPRGPTPRLAVAAAAA